MFFVSLIPPHRFLPVCFVFFLSRLFSSACVALYRYQISPPKKRADRRPTKRTEKKKNNSSNEMCLCPGDNGIAAKWMGWLLNVLLFPTSHLIYSSHSMAIPGDR